MSTVNTNDLRVKNAKNFIDSLNGPMGQGYAYMFIGRATQWPTDKAIPVVNTLNSGDAAPPTPLNNHEDFYETWDQMLSLKRIHDRDAFFMLPRITWTSGVIYDMYRHDYSEKVTSNSNAKNLYDARFYVINQAREVYVCLDNNKGGVSQVEPLNGGDLPFTTSDGYQWKKIYTISSYDMVNYGTNNYIPITADGGVTSDTVGAVHTVVVDSMGNDYTTSPTGIVNQIPYYFCKIVGDGRDAVARVWVSDGRITKVRVERPGVGYRYAKLDFVANRVYRNLIDLDNQENGLNPLGDGGFRSTVIISPPMGWGHNHRLLRQKRSTLNAVTYQEVVDKANYNIARQLGGTRVAVFSQLKFDTSDFIRDTTFRQVGILHNPDGYTIHNEAGATVYPETLTACKSLIVQNLTGSEGKYFLGETISQENEDGVAMGTVVGWSEVDGVYIVRYIQDPKIHSDKAGEMHYFRVENKIVGDTSETEAEPDSSYNDYIDHIQFRNGYGVPEILRYSGTFSYLLNLSPVTRKDTQSERVTLLISY